MISVSVVAMDLFCLVNCIVCVRIRVVLLVNSGSQCLTGILNSVLISVRLSVYALGGLVNVFFLIMIISAVVIQKEVVL